MTQTQCPEECPPRFEYYPESGQSLKTESVTKFPFLIGRGDNVQLKINSSCVSREHAALLKTDSGYALRDLDSMNGTEVNGQPVSETELHDGDCVRIADIELAFLCSAVGRLERMATQALGVKPKPRPRPYPGDGIESIRRMQEALLWQTLPLKWSRIVARTTGVEYARAVVFAGPHVPFLDLADAADDPAAVSLQARNLAWQIAASQVQPTSTRLTLLLQITQPAELNHHLLMSFASVAELLPESCRLGLLTTWNWTTSANSTEVLTELTAAGYALAMDGFSGGLGSLEAMHFARPDYLVLDKAVVRGVADQRRRYQRLESVSASCEQANILLVTPDGIRAEDEHACRQIGLDLVRNTNTSIATADALLPAELSVH